MRTPRLNELPPAGALWLEIDLARQSLTVWQGREALACHAISSGVAGNGQRDGSGQTPLGWHYVRAAIGGGEPPGTVFRGRRPTGEVFGPELAAAHPQRDWILTRILWLCGLERGFNRGGAVDSQRRYIYLHGTPDTEPMGRPASHGCIRLRDEALLSLFERAGPGTPVWLHD
ncbi:L,D-transpeptidase [Halomonas sp. HP20-15]|uniref:L,D-transpeptidase n=1 Tax=Halomonas sp. HP20-15 TaxID=3085901 RepID=UPI0029813041|nr:L,D-transpeptidase [Halomonas sp. HP20-15]MDW5378065.1 L,D-transpeptidase [Halomonas sp. HP20-15]